MACIFCNRKLEKKSAAKPAAKKILEESTLIRLYDGHELFGQSWSKTQAQPEAGQLTIQEGEDNGGN